MTKKLHILGYDYQILHSPPHYAGGMDSSGSCNTGHQIIVVEPTQTKQSQESTVLHEIIEALNYHLALELEHRVIMQLEAGLYQSLRDNKVSLAPLVKE